MHTESKTAVWAAILGNLAVAILKFVATAVTGSSAMLAEAIHSVVDTTDGLLLLFGMRRSRRPADEQHPFGYGKELYFWSFVVAMMIFGAGGGVAIYEGILHAMHPEPTTDVWWNYIVLGGAFVFEGTSLAVALRQFAKHQRGGFWRAMRQSKDPTSFTVILEDSAALTSLVIAALGVSLSQWLEIPVIDGIASILIGCLLILTSIVLGRECLGLIVGEGAEPEMLDAIKRIVEAQPGIVRVRDLLTMYFGPQTVLLTLGVEFSPDFGSEQVAHSIDRMEAAIVKRVPEIKRIYIEAEAIARKAESRSS